MPRFGRTIQLIGPRCRLQALFTKFDTTGSGSLSLTELTQLVATIYSSAGGLKLKHPPSKAEVAAAVRITVVAHG